MVRICPVSIPWFRSKNSGKWAKFAPEFAPVNFQKTGFFRRPSVDLSFLRTVQPLLDVWKCSWFDSRCGRGQKKLIFFKMFLVRFPTAAQPQNQTAAQPQKQKTPPPLVPPRTFIRGSFFENRPSKTVSLQNKQTNKQNQTFIVYILYILYIIYIVYCILYIICCMLYVFVVCCI